MEKGVEIWEEAEVSVEVGAEMDDMTSTFLNRDVNSLSNIGNDERRKTDTPPFATAAFAISQSM